MYYVEFTRAIHLARIYNFQVLFIDTFSFFVLQCSLDIQAGVSTQTDVFPALM
jgi:hypothetical protein